MNKLSFVESSKYFLHGLYRILTIAAFSLFLMTSLRFFAHAYYGNLRDFSEAPFETWMAYWIGFRFDLSALSYLSLIPVLVNLVTSLQRSRLWWWRGQKFNVFYLSFALLFLAICLVGDTGYYSYFQDHINVMLFGFFATKGH